jgi:hypothetical protein
MTTGGLLPMSNVSFTALGDDSGEDLPRTFRREKEARAREARERALQERANDPPSLGAPSPEPSMELRTAPDFDVDDAGDDGDFDGGVVRRFDIPFLHLSLFFLKAVVAAVPALILLGVILWFGGQLLETMFPELIKMKILISFPN